MYGKTNKKFNMPIAVISAFLMLGVVCLHTIPVFAYETIDNTDITIEFFVDDAIDIAVDQNVTGFVEVKVPLFIQIYLPTQSRYQYLSGYMTYGSGSILSSLQCTIDGSVPNYERFEGNYENGISISRPDASYPVVYFDNTFLDVNSSNDRYIKQIGFIVYNTIISDNNANVRFSNAKYTPSSPGTTTLRYTPYESGFTDAIIYALENASNMDDIVAILNSIDENSGYLPDVLTSLEYYDQQFYSFLVDIASDVDDLNSYVAEIFDILGSYNTQETQVAVIQDDIESNLSNLAHDMAVTRPSAVADIADTYINQIDTTYNSSVFGFLSIPTFILMLCIVFAFAVLSYLLYGGQ